MPKKARRKSIKQPLRCPSVIARSITNPSTWWNMGECVASWSARKVRPGTITRIGGSCVSMVRICTGEVCVRSTGRRPSAPAGR
jgi:hypothetical protein